MNNDIILLIACNIAQLRNRVVALERTIGINNERKSIFDKRILELKKQIRSDDYRHESYVDAIYDIEQYIVTIKNKEIKNDIIGILKERGMFYGY